MPCSLVFSPLKIIEAYGPNIGAILTFQPLIGTIPKVAKIGNGINELPPPIENQ